ncbi:unannotated protein [freshwater metagenome]|uniref:Unannotated protein n=1 Tax=freshwater metagenome TaxID=449393 RepID=A0A6J7SHY5_9ZZZZ
MNLLNVGVDLFGLPDSLQFTPATCNDTLGPGVEFK